MTWWDIKTPVFLPLQIFCTLLQDYNFLNCHPLIPWHPYFCPFPIQIGLSDPTLPNPVHFLQFHLASFLGPRIVKYKFSCLGLNAGSAIVSHVIMGKWDIHSLCASFFHLGNGDNSSWTLNEVLNERELEQCPTARKYSTNETCIYWCFCLQDILPPFVPTSYCFSFEKPPFLGFYLPLIGVLMKEAKIHCFHGGGPSIQTKQTVLSLSWAFEEAPQEDC